MQLIDNKLILQHVYIIISLLLIAFWLIMYFNKNVIIHPEVTYTYTKMLITDGNSIIEDSIKKTFDMQIVENGYYRPRILGFFIHWLDCNLLSLLATHCSHYGFRFPFVIVSNFLILLIAYKFFTMEIDGSQSNKSISFFLATTCLFIPAVFTSSYNLIRSAKILSGAACLFLIYLFCIISRSNNHFKQWLRYSIIVFLASTLDEQVFATSFYLLFCSIVINILSHHKLINQTVKIFFIGCLFYMLWHSIFGKIICGLFTENIVYTHPHQYKTLAINFINSLIPAFKILIENLLVSFGPLLIILCISICKDVDAILKMRNIIFIIPISFLLLVCCVATHPPIYIYLYTYRCMKYHRY